MTRKEIEDWKTEIDKMTRYDKCFLWRFSQAGHPIFSNKELYDYFVENWEGFTPEISKLIGW